MAKWKKNTRVELIILVVVIIIAVTLAIARTRKTTAPAAIPVVPEVETPVVPTAPAK